MKTIFNRNLLLFALLLFGSGTFAQSYTINSISDTTGSITYCDSLVELEFWADAWGWNQNVDNFYNINTTGMTFGDQMTIIVDWGDGSTTTYNGVYQSPTMSLLPPGAAQHYYNTGGSFPISMTVINPANNSIANHTGYFFNTSCPLYMYGYTNIDCDSNGVVDSTIYSGVDMILLGSNGNSYPFTTDVNVTVVPNLPSGTYTITIDPVWLAANNYQTLSITPSSFNFQSGYVGNITFIATVACDSVPPPNDGCVYGQVFCDDNNNGIHDAGEAGVYNAPVTVSYNNQTILVYTDPNGFYNLYAPNGNQSTAVVSVDGNWLGQSGYQYVSNSSTVIIEPCQSPNSTVVNFPINCDYAQPAMECIYGWVFCDANGNGVLDSGEVVLPNAPVQVSGNTGYTTTIYADSNGVISYSSQAFFGGYAVLSIPQWWLTQHGYTIANNILTVQTDCNNPTPAYFAVNCSPTLCADLWTTVNPWIGYYQNNTNYIKLKWGNYGPNATTGYTLSLTYPSSVTPILSSIANSNYVIVGNTITWTFGPGASYINQQDVIGFSVPSGYPSGTSHSYTSTITPLGSTADCDPLNNDGSLCMILGNSYDPNDKSTSHTPIIDPTVQDELTYVIRFQNTGTAPAQDVYIIDTLSNNLDWSTLKVISTSHNMHLVDLGNGVMKFNFPGIWLPDSTANEPESHGDVVFSIKENAGNGIGSVIENTGYIYFDWNPAIITNTTVNTNDALGLDEAVNEVGISPNPFTGTVSVASAKKIDLITVLDITGKVIFETTVNDFNAELELNGLTQGIYFVNVTAGTEVSTSKVVKN